MDPPTEQIMEALLAEAVYNNREAIRLFKDERESLLRTGCSQNMNSNLSRANIGWILTHLRQVERKLDDIHNKLYCWKQLRDAVESATTKNVAVKCSYLEEKRRTASIYHSLHESISLKQNQESQWQELNNKYLILLKQHQDTLTEKNQIDDSYCLTKESVDRELKELKKSKVKTNEESQDVKRRKLSSNTIDLTSASTARKSKHLRDGKKICIPSRGATKKWLNALPEMNAGVIDKSKYQKSDNVAEIIGRKVRRNFPGHGVFTGTVKSFKSPYYTICYEDGDKEEMTLVEMREWLVDL
jgi:deoxyribodipyrimidine photolyase